jgi:hypothetical protein
VVDLDLYPVNDVFVSTSILDGVSLLVRVVLVVPFFIPTLTSLVPLEVFPYRVLIKFYRIQGSFMSSNREILALVFFKSSKKSYSNFVGDIEGSLRLGV